MGCLDQEVVWTLVSTDISGREWIVLMTDRRVRLSVFEYVCIKVQFSARCYSLL